MLPSYYDMQCLNTTVSPVSDIAYVDSYVSTLTPGLIVCVSRTCVRMKQIVRGAVQLSQSLNFIHT